MTGVQTCALPICFPVTIPSTEEPKSQLVAAQNTEEIICVFCGKGRGHDFSLFKKSRVLFHPLTTSREDSGDQGIAAYHSNSYTPKKKPKNRKLTDL